MCPACFRAWQSEAFACSLRDWLVAFGRLQAPANDVRGLLRHPPARSTLRELIQL